MFTGDGMPFQIHLKTCLLPGKLSCLSYFRYERMFTITWLIYEMAYIIIVRVQYLLTAVQKVFMVTVKIIL